MGTVLSKIASIEPETCIGVSGIRGYSAHDIFLQHRGGGKGFLHTFHALFALTAYEAVPFDDMVLRSWVDTTLVDAAKAPHELRAKNQIQHRTNNMLEIFDPQAVNCIDLASVAAPAPYEFGAPRRATPPYLEVTQLLARTAPRAMFELLSR
jgi:hypothetical protein